MREQNAHIFLVIGPLMDPQTTDVWSYKLDVFRDDDERRLEAGDVIEPPRSPESLFIHQIRPNLRCPSA